MRLKQPLKTRLGIESPHPVRKNGVIIIAADPFHPALLRGQAFTRNVDVVDTITGSKYPGIANFWPEFRLGADLPALKGNLNAQQPQSYTSLGINAQWIVEPELSTGLEGRVQLDQTNSQKKNGFTNGNATPYVSGVGSVNPFSSSYFPNQASTIQLINAFAAVGEEIMIVLPGANLTAG